MRDSEGVKRTIRPGEGRAKILWAFLALAAPTYAVTFTTIPAAITAGAPTQTLEIFRSLSAGDEGFSADEMDSFNWYGPSNPYPAGPPIKLPRGIMHGP